MQHGDKTTRPKLDVGRLLRREQGCELWFWPGVAAALQPLAAMLAMPRMRFDGPTASARNDGPGGERRQTVVVETFGVVVAACQRGLLRIANADFLIHSPRRAATSGIPPATGNNPIVRGDRRTALGVLRLRSGPIVVKLVSLSVCWLLGVGRRVLEIHECAVSSPQ
jgi:hypothetical protein